MLLSSFVGREEAEKRGEKLPCFFTKTLAKRERTILSSIRLRLCLSPLFFFFPSPLPHLYSSKMKRSCLFSPIFFMKNPLASLFHFIKTSDFFVPSMLDYTLFHFSSFPFPALFSFFPLFPFFFFLRIFSFEFIQWPTLYLVPRGI